MALDEYLPAILVIVGIFFLIRYLGRSSEPANLQHIPGITAATVETVHAAFPDVPLPNIIYSLAKTRSGQATSEEIIIKGSLPAPPATFVIPPSLLPATVNPPSEPSSPATSTFGRGTHNRSPAASAAGSKTAPATSLIERYGLSSRVSSRKGKEVDEGEHGAAPPVPDSASSAAAAATPGPLGGGKGKWEDTREGREKGLKERKERMILEARRRLLEKQAQTVQSASA